MLLRSTLMLALMLLTEARRPARTSADGTMVRLADQDRSLWSSGLIAEGHSLVRACLRRNAPGPFQIQAAIAAVQLYAGRGVASHHSALVLHGLPLHQVDLRRVYLERSDTAHGRARSGVVLRAGRSLRTTATMEGWATPVPTISVADACILSGAVHGASSGLVAADAGSRLACRLAGTQCAAQPRPLSRLGGKAGCRQLATSGK